MIVNHKIIDKLYRCLDFGLVYDFVGKGSWGISHCLPNLKGSDSSCFGVAACSVRCDVGVVQKCIEILTQQRGLTPTVSAHKQMHVCHVSAIDSECK